LERERPAIEIQKVPVNQLQLATLSLQRTPRELDRGWIDVAAKPLGPRANGTKQDTSPNTGVEAGLGVDLQDRLSHQLRDRRRGKELAEGIPPLTRVDLLQLVLGRSDGRQEHTLDPTAPLG
jgi:hypothetical protein